MKKIRIILFTDWHIMRFVRLAFGIFFGIMAYINADSIAALASAFFLYQSLMNISCGLNNSCRPATYKTNDKAPPQDVIYEEIK